MIKIGLCGFTIGIAEYLETFPVVEIQHTFYEPPPATTMARWRDQAGPGFEFTIKAWQVITHRGTSSTYRKVKTPLTAKQKDECGGFQVNETTRAAWDRTRDAARTLRATAILFQCPASFEPIPENVANLRAFFAAIERPPEVRFLWEPRGAWPDELIRELCVDLQLTHAVDPFLRTTVTPDFVYFRLHGLGNAYRAYTDDELRRLVEMATSGAPAYVMFNEVPRVADSKRFRKMLAAGRTPSR